MSGSGVEVEWSWSSWPDGGMHGWLRFRFGFDLKMFFKIIYLKTFYGSCDISNIYCDCNHSAIMMMIYSNLMRRFCPPPLANPFLVRPLLAPHWSVQRRWVVWTNGKWAASLMRMPPSLYLDLVEGMQSMRVDLQAEEYRGRISPL